MAAGLLGAYPTPVNWHDTAEEARYIFENSGAKAIVIHSDLLEAIRAVVPAGVHVLHRAHAARDRDSLRRAAAINRCAPGRAQLGNLARRLRALVWRCQAKSGHHHLHLRHHRKSEGRAPRLADAGAGRGVHAQPLRHLRPDDAPARPDHQRDDRPDVSLRAQRLRHGRRAPGRNAASRSPLRARRPAADDRAAQGHAHPHGADHVQPAAETAGRGEAEIRPLLAEVRRPRRRPMPAADQARDDRMVGAGDQRILRLHRNRRRGVLHVRGMARAPRHSRHAHARRRRADHRRRRQFTAAGRDRRGGRRTSATSRTSPTTATTTSAATPRRSA